MCQFTNNQEVDAFGTPRASIDFTMKTKNSLAGALIACCAAPLFVGIPTVPSPVQPHAPRTAPCELRTLAQELAAPASSVFTTHEPTTEQTKFRAAEDRLRAALARSDLAPAAVSEATALVDRLSVREKAVFTNYQLGYVFDARQQLESVDRSLDELNRALTAAAPIEPSNPAPSTPTPPAWSAFGAAAALLWLLRRVDTLDTENEVLRGALTRSQLRPSGIPARAVIVTSAQPLLAEA